MSRTNVDVDDDMLDQAMRMYGLQTKRETIALALRKLVGEPMTRDDLLAMGGTMTEADFDPVVLADHAEGKRPSPSRRR